MGTNDEESDDPVGATGLELCNIAVPNPPERPDDWMDDEAFEACVLKEIEYRQFQAAHTAKCFLAGDARRLEKYLRGIKEVLSRQPSLALAMLQGGSTQLMIVEADARKETHDIRSEMDRVDRELDALTSAKFTAYQRVKKEGRRRFKENKPTE